MAQASVIQRIRIFVKLSAGFEGSTALVLESKFGPICDSIVPQSAGYPTVFMCSVELHY